jgi:prepilin-type N-terminal cleavage/methylation domain-containing protein
MKKRTFSLIELLVVILLVGIVYSLYFVTKKETKKDIPFTLFTMKQFLKEKSIQYKKDLKLIYYYDEKRVYLTDKNNLIYEVIPFDKQVTTYMLKHNEVLEVKVYRNIELDDKYFEPTFIYSKFEKEIYSHLILNTINNKWLYFNSYFGKDVEEFLNETQMIDYIKKKSYMPMYAGKIE